MTDTPRHRVRVALREGGWRDQVESFARDEGLERTHASADGHSPYELVWAKDGTALHYIEDPILGWAYLQGEGQGSKALIERAAGALPAVPLEEAVAKAAEADGGQGWIDALYLLAASASPDEPAPPAVVAQFERAMADGDKQARLAAIYATGYLGWPELQDILDRAINDDPDDEVSEAAEMMLEGIDQAGV